MQAILMYYLWFVSNSYLRGWHYGECVHDPVWVFLTDLGDEECSHAGAGATTEGVCQLESLKTVAALRFFADNIEYGVYELSTLGVVSLGPVVSCSALSEYKVVWTEDLAEGAGSD